MKTGPLPTLASLVVVVLWVASLSLGTAAESNTTKPGGPTPKPKPYPLKVCLVSTEKLDGAMGEPVAYVYKGQEFKFCCQDCQAKFAKEPVKYVKRLEDKLKQQKAVEEWLKAHRHP